MGKRKVGRETSNYPIQFKEPLHRRAIPDLSDLMKEAEEFNLTEGVDVNSTLDNAT